MATNMPAVQRRKLGKTDIAVSTVSMGCWPIAGMTSLGVTEESSLATLAAAVDAGVNFFDTAYGYGAEGESETLIAKALGRVRDSIVIATKGGIHWGEDGGQRKDASPTTLRRECDESLRRLSTDRVELYYLHCPDPDVPIEESAGAMLELMNAGKVRSTGVSNFTLEQLRRFHTVCPITAYQPPYNMILRDIETDQLPWCTANDVSVCVYWPLMKGLLAGKLPRDHAFADKDGRKKYPMFQGDEWQRNQDLLDALRPIAAEANVTLAQLVIHWTITRPGVTNAICGAKRPEQIKETAGAMEVELTAAQREAIEKALQARGEPVTRWAV